MFDFGIVSIRPTGRVYQIVLLMRQPRRSPMPHLFRTGAAFSLDPQRLPWFLVGRQQAAQAQPG
jgi:hypothetical protein